MRTTYQNEIAAAIVDASDRLVGGFKEFLFCAEVGSFLGSFSRIADSLERIATALDGINISDNEEQSLASAVAQVADAISEKK